MNPYRLPSAAFAVLLLAAAASAPGGLHTAAPLQAQQVAPQGDLAPPPTPAEVLGYELGERYTDHADVVRYMESLADASPAVQIRQYGTTPEGRPLVQTIIARPDHHERLVEILARNRQLAEPGKSEAEANGIVASNPAVVYFTYGVHGDESSSSEAALYTAWDLARGTENVAGVLDSVVVILDPSSNPDGRDRYVHWYRQARGALPNPHPEAREHHQPWPGGRYSHYLFDLNRDWAWATQPVTRARLATWDVWNPQVHVDFHEMSWRSSYFFFPATPPLNPLYPQHTLEWGERFGAANAAAFEALGWQYYTTESFDLFYPGYGDSWPSLVGAIGMTYEQAGQRGLAIRRPDGSLLTLRERAQHHRTSGAATLRTVAERKSELLGGFAEFHRMVDDGLSDILLVPGEDPSRMDALLAILERQGIRVEAAAQSFQAGGARAHPGFETRRAFPAGSYLVRARQPRGRLAATLLQPEMVLEGAYTYDITAWSLPLAFGVEAHRVESVPDVGWTVVGEASPPPARLESITGGAPPRTEYDGTAASLPDPVFGPQGRAGFDAAADDDGRADVAGEAPPAVNPAASLGYLVTPGFAAWPGLVRFLAAGGRVRVLERPFTLDGREWPAGTFYLPRRGDNRLDARLAEAGGGVRERAHGVRTGLTPEGHDLGTETAYDLTLPRVVVLTGEGVSPTSYGAHWYFLEQTLGLPFDAIPVRTFGSLDLSEYDVLVLPELGSRARSVLSDATEDIERWVRGGGTLVAVGSGAGAVADSIAEVKEVPELGETGVADDGEAGDPPGAGDPDVSDSGTEAEPPSTEQIERALRGREARRLDRWQESVPGVVLPLRLDLAHPLAFGAGLDGDPERLFILHRGTRTFRPDESFETVAFYPPDPQRLSGVISDANRERLGHTSWLVSRELGSGRVILFADDPLFRHFWYATFQPFANALLIGPAM